MKTMKRFAALLLVVVLMAAMLVVPANAADGGSIVITNSIKEVTYSAYKMFDLTTNGANAYTYTINSAWAEFFSTGAGKDYVTVTNGYVTIKDGKNVALADAAAEYAKANLTTTLSATSTGGTLSIEVPSNGYYVVATSLTNQHGFGATIDNGSVITVNEKNALPTIDKNSTGTAGVGDVVDYTIVINVEGHIEADYVVNDNMAGGKLALVAGTVEVSGISSGMTYVTNADGSVTFTLAKDVLEPLAAGAAVTITYKATVVSAGEIKNKVVLNQTVGTPDDSETTSYNYNIDITKKAGDTGNFLAGAKFVLTRGAGEATQYAKHDTDGKFIGWMEAAAAVTSTGYVPEVIWTSSSIDGKIAINGVPTGTYTLKEIEAPDGYQLADDTTITITDAVNNNDNSIAEPDGKIDGDTDNTKSVTVVNNTGSRFPSTGGIGTTIFYALGGIMVLAAVVFIITRRRMIEE